MEVWTEKLRVVTEHASIERGLLNVQRCVAVSVEVSQRSNIRWTVQVERVLIVHNGGR